MMMMRTFLSSSARKSRRCRHLVSALLFLRVMLHSRSSSSTFTCIQAFTPIITTVLGRRHSRTTNRRKPLLWGTSGSSTVPPPTPRIVSYLNLKNSTTIVAPSPTDNVGVGALSMTIHELTNVLGSGKIGRAQLVWDCYTNGIDPAIYFYTTAADDYNDETFVLQKALLPSTRRHVRLGREALQKLAQTYATSSTFVTTSSSITPLRVEGGVASLVHVSRSADGTTKMLLQLRDGLEVESVIIPIDKKQPVGKKTNTKNENEQNNQQEQQQQPHKKKRSSTVCLSSQVGCRQACTFCATGRMGIQRNLTSDEILAQFYFATKLTRLYKQRGDDNDSDDNDDDDDFALPRINNVVFMGMGDAADNAVAVTRAVRILTSQFQLAAQKVTVSTVGPTPQAFMDLTTPDAPCVLAWSVHAAQDEIRQRLVPTMKSRGYSVEQLRNGLIQALLHRPIHLRTTMLQVTLLKNINDSLEQADALAALAETIVQGVPGCKLMVNLIPWNDINHGDNNNNTKQQLEHDEDADVLSSSSPLHYQRPSPATIDAFQQRLWQRGIYAKVRTTRGDDTTAACGQLATTMTAAKAATAAAVSRTTTTDPSSS